MQEGEQWVLEQHDGRHREISRVYPPLQLHVEVEVTSHQNLFPLSSQCGSTSICSKQVQERQNRPFCIAICMQGPGASAFMQQSVVEMLVQCLLPSFSCLLFSCTPLLVCRARSSWDRVLWIPYFWVKNRGTAHQKNQIEISKR